MADLSTTHSRVMRIPPERWTPPQRAIELHGLRLEPKPELHLTLVGRALDTELRATLGHRAQALVDTIHGAQDWRFERSGHHLLLRKPVIEGGRSTIAHAVVELVELPAMALFQRALGRLLGRQLPVPPPHVTLYTAGRAQGIGISSPARLRAFTVRRVMAHELD